LTPPADESFLIPFIASDQVSFASQTPWPESAGGTGDTLTRKVVGYGMSPDSWIGNSPTPGATDLAVRWRGDANEDGHFNSSDLVRTMMAGKFETRVAATFAEGDWNGDGFFDSDDLLAALATARYES
jgi:hypothetical protein